MISFQIRDELLGVLRLLEPSTYLLQCLNSFAAQQKTVDQNLSDLMSSSEVNSVTNASNKLRSHLSSIRSKSDIVKPGQFFLSLDAARSKFSAIRERGFSGEAIVEINESLGRVHLLYEDFLGTYSPKSAVNLLSEVGFLLGRIDGFRSGVRFYIDNISASQPDDDLGRLSLLLPSAMNLHEFLAKLQSVERIYKELCDLMSVSIVDYPIDIIKIESGSLGVDVFGNPQVMDFLRDMVMAGGAFIYGRYTKEGRLSSFPKKLSAIEGVLGLRTKLKENGVNIEGMDEHINKASVHIAREVASLISGQSEVKVNGKVLSVAQEVEKKLSQSDETLRIEFDSDTDE